MGLMVAGIDCGRHAVKYYANGKKGVFKAAVGEWRQRRLQNEGARYEVELNGARYFVADLAADESYSGRAMGTHGKTNMETKVLFWTALAIIASDTKAAKIAVISGLPIEQHTAEQKQAFIKLLAGTNEIAVNDNKIRITLEPDLLAIAAEGTGLYWDTVLDDDGQISGLLSEGDWYFIEGGSRTINFGLMRDRRYIDKASGSLQYGMVELENMAARLGAGAEGQFARRIISDIAWQWPNFNPQKDRVLIGGGLGLKLESYLRAELRRSQLAADPIFGNARGFAKMGALKWQTAR